MNAPACCHAATPRPGAVQRGLNLLQWLVPGTVLVLMPKCPVCLAAYIALGTGIGLSLPVAAYLRIALLVLCIASLSYLALRSLRRLCLTRRTSLPSH
jgi:hypothetical protein